jgi:hypothetical protein
MLSLGFLYALILTLYYQPTILSLLLSLSSIGFVQGTLTSITKKLKLEQRGAVEREANTTLVTYPPSHSHLVVCVCLVSLRPGNGNGSIAPLFF